MAYIDYKYIVHKFNSDIDAYQVVKKFKSKAGLKEFISYELLSKRPGKYAVLDVAEHNYTIIELSPVPSNIEHDVIKICYN